MGRQRASTWKIGYFFSCLLLISLVFTSSCIKKTSTTSDQMVLEEWVKQEKTTDGKLKYPLDAKVTISSPLTVSFPDIEAYRASIASQDKQWEGIFFINKKDKSVQFFEATLPKPEG